MFHFTEQKIRVHVFYCVLALAVARLMVREADHAGMHQSVRELLDTLAGIEETVLLYHGDGRPRARRMLTEMDLTTASPLRPVRSRRLRPGAVITLIPTAWAALEAALRERRPVRRHLPRPRAGALSPRPRLEERTADAARLPRRMDEHRST